MKKRQLGDFKRELRELLKKYDCTIGAEVEGDTHGITEEFCVWDRKTGEKLDIFEHWSPTIDYFDLVD